MSWSTLSDTLLQVGKAVKREILTTVKSNDDDHETRILALEGGASKVIVFDEIIDLASYYRTGDVRWSFLTEAQFQAKYGTDWVAIKGQSISGTDLATLWGTATLPDFRNRFPRITDESTRLIGAIEAQQNEAHTHVQQVGDNTGTPAVQTMVDFATAGTYSGKYYNYGGTDTTANRISTQSSGGTEARPDSGVLSCFIKKSDLAIDQIRLFKAPFGFTLTNAVVTTLVAGSAGTLECDLLNGSTLGSLSTVFSTKPSVAQASGSNASSSNAVFSDSTVDTNDWLQLDITSLQTGQERFHVIISGELS